jgi:heptosyltransferase-3
VTRARRDDEHPALWRRAFSHFYALPKGRPRHTVETNLDALRRIGIAPAPEDKRLVLAPGAAANRRIDELLAANALAPGAFTQLHPGSRWLFKTWPPARVAALVERLVSGGQRIVLTGAPDARERAIVDEVLAGLSAAARESVCDLTGQLSLRELAALTARARLFVGVDSAPMHIAAAVGTPTVALFGPSDDIEWGPWQVAHRIVASDDFPCRPCRRDGCGGGKVSECLTTLPAERVGAAIDAVLAQTVPR